MDFNELLTCRRSVRHYRQEPVPTGLITELISESILAPSAGNGQPWKFVIVNSREMMKKISDESKKNILARIEKDPDDYAARYESLLSQKDYNVFYNAPSLVLILGPKGLRNLYVDCALAAAYFMMAAAARGLGTCWVNMGRFIDAPELTAVLGIPDGSDIVAPIALGYPAKIPPIPKRKPPEILEIVD